MVSLYQAALTLPAPKAEFSDPPQIDVHAEVTRVRAACSRLPVRYYSEQFDTLVVPPTEPTIVGDLVDDISDVFADVRKGIVLFDEGHLSAAHWEWTFGFQAHWGRHAVSAIRALHVHLSENGWENRATRA